MRTLIVAGAAGSGVSTVAEGLARRFAREGGRTLLLSLSPTAAPKDPQAAGEGLVRHDVAPLSWADSRWAALQPLLRWAPGPWAAAAELEPLPVPGLAELALLDTLRGHWGSGWDTVVVDGGDVAAALRWLTLPDTAEALLRTAWPTAARAGLGGGQAPAGLQLPQRVLEWLNSETAETASQLRSRAVATVLVTGPEQHHLQRVLPALGALALHEAKITDLVLNGYSAHRDRDRALRHRLSEALPGTTIRAVATHRGGAADAGELGGELFPELPERPSRVHDTVRVGRDGQVYTWRWRLPLVAASAVAATRTGEEFLLTVGQHRRRMLLPSVLRRCTPLDSTMSGGTLELRFAPDPDQWPVPEEGL